MAVTIVDVAARAQVGVGTVSRVLNNHSAVTEATRRKVLSVIQELGYRPSPQARALRKGRTMRIACVVPFVTHPGAVERLRGLTAVIRPTPYQLVLFDVETPEHRDECFAGLAHSHQADAVVVFSFPPSDAEVRAFAAAGVSIVLVDAGHPRLPHVLIDDTAGGRIATEHLLELGHHRVGFVGDDPDNPFGFVSSARRCDGYHAALADAGVGGDPALVRSGPHGRETAYRLGLELLDLPDPPTAVFAASDTQALGVLQATRERGLRVPEDLSIVGFDDIEVASYVGLTTVAQPLEASGRLAGELLFDALAGEQAGPTSRLLPLQLMARDTTGPVSRR